MSSKNDTLIDESIDLGLSAFGGALPNRPRCAPVILRLHSRKPAYHLDRRRTTLPREELTVKTSPGDVCHFSSPQLNRHKGHRCFAVGTSVTLSKDVVGFKPRSGKTVPSMTSDLPTRTVTP